MDITYIRSKMIGRTVNNDKGQGVIYSVRKHRQPGSFSFDIKTGTIEKVNRLDIEIKFPDGTTETMKGIGITDELINNMPEVKSAHP